MGLARALKATNETINPQKGSSRTALYGLWFRLIHPFPGIKLCPIFSFAPRLQVYFSFPISHVFIQPRRLRTFGIKQQKPTAIRLSLR